jgi:hypothetical protein
MLSLASDRAVTFDEGKSPWARTASINPSGLGRLPIGSIEIMMAVAPVA